jgi:hypothetical protein
MFDASRDNSPRRARGQLPLLLARFSAFLRDDGSQAEEEASSVKLYIARLRHLGPDHPDTLTSMANLAYSWRSQDFSVKALRLLSECFELQKKQLGVDHPETRASAKYIEEWQSK